ncbi:MAG: hypothetical protein M3Y56_16290 [Armatimonadota bacterium]|nr:hypothetical protein [Armatimonadota bacterium]
MRQYRIKQCCLLMVTLLSLGVVWNHLLQARPPGNLTGYRIIDLGAAKGAGFNGARSFYPVAINSRSQVIGYSPSNVGYGKTMLWANGSIVELRPYPGSHEPVPTGMNDRGDVVGVVDLDISGHSTDEPKAGVIWKAGKPFPLAGQPQLKETEANAISNRRQVVGFCSYGEKSEGFLWQDGQYSPLKVSGAYDINDHGQIVGNNVSNGWKRGYLWQNGKSQDLATLLDLGPCTARHINNRGQILGWSEATGPFLGTNGHAVSLSPLRGETATAWAVNDKGQVVGCSSGRGINEHAAVLWEAGRVYNLNDFIPRSSGWTLKRAYAINNLGQIAGTGQLNGSKYSRAFLLMPVRRAN